MLIPSAAVDGSNLTSSLSRRVNANSQHVIETPADVTKLIKKGEC